MNNSQLIDEVRTEIGLKHFSIRTEQAYVDGIGYTFLDGMQFNLEYWRGHTDMGEYEICVRVHEPNQ